MTKNLIIIGTLHCKSTPHQELVEVLENIAPDKLLVELAPEELGAERRKTSIRDEMLAAYDWAIHTGVAVEVFDSENDILRDGITGQEPAFQEYSEVSKRILRSYSWKELNQADPWNAPELQALDKAMDLQYIDPVKSARRDTMLLNEIKNKIIAGKNVVLVGAGHLDLLQKHLPDAEFPFREKSHQV